MIPSINLAHATDALGLLIDQYKARPVIEGLLKSFVGSIQTIEAMLFDLINLRTLSTATGDQLTKIGAILGEPRYGRNDTDYRAALYLVIKVHRSQGTAEDVISTAVLGLPETTPAYSEVFPGGWQVVALNILTASGMLRLLGKAKAAGTRGIFVYSTWSQATTFTFDTVGGGVAGALGPGDSVAQLIVSKQTSAQEVKP